MNIKVIDENIEKRQIINKDYNLINARYKLSTVQTKMILKIVSLIDNKNDKEFLIYKIPLNYFDFLTDNKHHTRLKVECKNLMTKALEIPTDNGWLVTNWFSSIKYIKNENVLQCSIDPELKPYLVQLKKNFKYYQISYIMKMKSEYSIRIYELLKQYESTFTRKRKFELAELQDILQIPKSYTSNFKYFRVPILDRAVREVNEYSDLIISYEAIKRGRPVFWVEFTIMKNERNIIKKEAFDNLIEFNEIKHKDFKLMFKKFKFDLEEFNNEFSSFCLYNKNEEIKITLDNFQKWCMQKKRKLVERTEKDNLINEQKEYRWNFRKAKKISDDIKDWLKFELGIDWLNEYYWKDKPLPYEIGVQKVIHPDFDKEEYILYKLSSRDNNTKYLLANKSEIIDIK